MTFTEANTVEAMVHDLLCGPQKATFLEASLDEWWLLEGVWLLKGQLPGR